MLIGEKEYLFKPLIECPLKDCPIVRASGDCPTVLPTERFYSCARIHVSDRTNCRCIDILTDLFPRVKHLFATGHITHRAPSFKIGQNDNLIGSTKNIGRLGHKMDAAENDELTVFQL